jgi:hypothetical protein
MGCAIILYGTRDTGTYDGRRINGAFYIAAGRDNNEREQERESAHLGLQGERDRTIGTPKMRPSNVHLQHMHSLK